MPLSQSAKSGQLPPAWWNSATVAGAVRCQPNLESCEGMRRLHVWAGLRHVGWCRLFGQQRCNAELRLPSLERRVEAAEGTNAVLVRADFRFRPPACANLLSFHTYRGFLAQVRADRIKLKRLELTVGSSSRERPLHCTS